MQASATMVGVRIVSSVSLRRGSSDTCNSTVRPRAPATRSARAVASGPGSRTRSTSALFGRSSTRRSVSASESSGVGSAASRA